MRLAASGIHIVQTECDWAQLYVIFARSIGQYSAKLPVYWKNAARKIIWIKKMSKPLKDPRTYATYVRAMA